MLQEFWHLCFFICSFSYYTLAS